MPSTTRLTHAPDDEHAQSLIYGSIGGALAAPPLIGSAASATKWAWPHGPWLVLRASPGSQAFTTSGRPSRISADAASAGQAG